MVWDGYTETGEYWKTRKKKPSLTYGIIFPGYQLNAMPLAWFVFWSWSWCKFGVVLLPVVVPPGRDAIWIGSLAGTVWVKHESD